MQSNLKNNKKNTYMVKNILKKITIIFILISAIFLINSSFWEINIPWAWEIKNVSMDVTVSGKLEDDTNQIFWSAIILAKVILQWLLVAFIVYIWIQMVLSMWSDEDKLTKSKTQLRYTLIAIVFINIPWYFFYSFYNPGQNIDWVAERTFDWNTESTNLFFNSDMFKYTFWDQIIWFLEIGIFAIAIIMIILAWLNIMKSRGREDDVKKWKMKILYSAIALIFVSIIEALRTFAFKWEIDTAMSIFKTFANLALYFAAPVWIFFLSLAWYYLITSNWDEEKAKKAKSIVINVILWTLILLAAYTFLLDISNL
jgi:hypothetical protein